MSARFLRSILNQPKLPSTKVPEHVKDAVFGRVSENSQLNYLWQYRKGSIRRRYANFGQNSGKQTVLCHIILNLFLILSGLKAGICWPSREELQFMNEYEAKFEKSFETMKSKLESIKVKEKKTREARENEIVSNLAKLPKIKQEFWENYHKLYDDIEKDKVDKEKIIQEVREYLGYDIESNDPRFEEALAKKDEDEKAAQRAARKLEKQRQNLEMLQALVSEAMEKEKEVKKGKNVAAQPNDETPQSS